MRLLGYFEPQGLLLGTRLFGRVFEDSNASASLQLCGNMRRSDSIRMGFIQANRKSNPKGPSTY